jgi:hypothetical protein
MHSSGDLLLLLLYAAFSATEYVSASAEELVSVAVAVGKV